MKKGKQLQVLGDPAERGANARQHRQPLAAAALAPLEERLEGDKGAQAP